MEPRDLEEHHARAPIPRPDLLRASGWSYGRDNAGDARRASSSVAVAITGIVTAVQIVAKRREKTALAQLDVGTERLPMDETIIATASATAALEDVQRKFSAWRISVPRI